MKLRYKGVMSGFFRLSDGGGFAVKVGQVYDIPKEQEKKLLAHPNWEKVEDKKEEVKEEVKEERKSYNKKY